MNYSFVIALVFSIVWHSLAFVLFKLAEPYNVKPQKYEIVNVDLILQDQVLDGTLDSLRKIDFFEISRFSLPSESGQRMPSPEINVDLQKKLSYLKTQPIYEKSLIKHRSIIDLKVRGDKSLNNLKEKVPDYAYPPEKSINRKMIIDDSAKTVLFLLRGIDREPVDSYLPDSNLILSSPLVIKFSLDNMGNVKFAVIEKSSGNSQADKIVLSLFKKWRFEKTMILNDLEMRRSAVTWGNIVFYLK